MVWQRYRLRLRSSTLKHPVIQDTLQQHGCITEHKTSSSTLAGNTFFNFK
jgi:hypothetical protein